MSNITTDFVRIHAWAGHSIDRDEAEWITERLLSDRGSYWVPVNIHLASDRSHVDIQYGGGKSIGMVDFWDDYGDQYDAVWTRRSDPAHRWDIIWRGGPNTGYRKARFCRYVFDEVRVTGPASELPPIHAVDFDAIRGRMRGRRAFAGAWRPHADGIWRLKVRGTYLTCNSRVDMSTGPKIRGVDWNTPRANTRSGGLATPTTPCYDDGGVKVLEPTELTVISTDGGHWRSTTPAIQRLEFFWRGRLVHRAQEDYDDFLEKQVWRHLSADGWDNCADPEFLRS
ncbi:hypothetical protein [Actinomadura sp. HBU206391]|uniref:hypothetical protein n=1 Tax=Actinomadura sp. HBU206391 TaxID=2731692 RepID=UPI001650BF7F|nr:hypothetical protein [Actinomadura sp. HBU206391]MBC6462341.1 hypothetical protein [Actinomadura sp. HBU206391]